MIAFLQYLERAAVPMPGSEEQYSDRDLFVGAVLLIHGSAFELTGADEYTLQVMEDHRCAESKVKNN